MNAITEARSTGRLDSRSPGPPNSSLAEMVTGVAKVNEAQRKQLHNNKHGEKRNDSCNV
jgi:hypothetical protein